MYIENFYVGSIHHVIVFEDGIHKVIDTDMHDIYIEHGADPTPAVLFVGFYEKCVAFKNDLLIKYAESLF